jgi:hypothetical protein
MLRYMERAVERAGERRIDVGTAAELVEMVGELRESL